MLLSGYAFKGYVVYHCPWSSLKGVCFKNCQLLRHINKLGNEFRVPCEDEQPTGQENKSWSAQFGEEKSRHSDPSHGRCNNLHLTLQSTSICVERISIKNGVQPVPSLGTSPAGGFLCCCPTPKLLRLTDTDHLDVS